MITCLFLCVFLFVLGALPSGNTRRQWNHEATPPAADGRLNSLPVISPSLLKESFPAYTKFHSTGFSNKLTNKFLQKKSHVKTSKQFQVQISGPPNL